MSAKVVAKVTAKVSEISDTSGKGLKIRSCIADLCVSVKVSPKVSPKVSEKVSVIVSPCVTAKASEQVSGILSAIATADVAPAVTAQKQPRRTVRPNFRINPTGGNTP